MSMTKHRGLWTRSVILVLAVLTGLSASAGPQSSTSTGAQPDKRIKRDYGFFEPEPLDFDDHQGYVQIFDGVSLKNWDGDPNTWHIEEGAIVGESTKEKPLANSYISFHGFEAKDMDLKFEIRVENGGGSGIQYRSQVGLPWTRQPQRRSSESQLDDDRPAGRFLVSGHAQNIGMDWAVLFGEHASRNPRLAGTSRRVISRKPPKIVREHWESRRARRLR